MTVSVGLMGFGRIGRNVFRQLEDAPNIEVTAIADIADPAALVYLLEFDTIFGRFPGDVNLDGSDLIVDGRRVPILGGADPGEIDWAKYGVDIVVQATRKHRTLTECRRHIERGASKVILASTPSDWTEMDTLIVGVNDDVLGPEDDVIALGSNTSNALAPVLQVLDDRFGLDRAMFTVVHAFTNEQRLADVPGGDLRMSRAAAENIIPSPTKSPAVVEKVLPGLAGKLAGISLNVPVADGSNIDLVAFVETPTTIEAVNLVMSDAARANHVIGYTDDPIVSSDVIGTTQSALWDAKASMVIDGNIIKSILWFDNGWGYAARVVDVISRLAELLPQGGHR